MAPAQSVSVNQQRLGLMQQLQHFHWVLKIRLKLTFLSIIHMGMVLCKNSQFFFFKKLSYLKSLKHGLEVEVNWENSCWLAVNEVLCSIYPHDCRNPEFWRWWRCHAPAILALGRWKQEGQKLKVLQGPIASLSPAYHLRDPISKSTDITFPVSKKQTNQKKVELL